MSKSIFRWLRGELNGFYLKNIHDTTNAYTEDVRDFLHTIDAEQFEAGMIRDKDLYGIGSFAGIFLPRLSRAEAISSIRMSESFIDEFTEEEISERGLFDIENERFNFMYLSEGEDINSYSTTASRSSLVGDEDVRGYIYSTEDYVINDDGKVRVEKVMETPPTDNTAYSEFYGNNFLFLSEGEVTYSNLPPTLYIELVKSLQWIRYNGQSLETVCRIVELVCPEGLVTIDGVEVAPDGKHLNLYYAYDDSSAVTLKLQRLNLLTFIIDMKFPQVKLVENLDRSRRSM